MPKISSPLKYHGGKTYLAKRIIDLMPPRCKNPNAPETSDPGYLHYVEPYFGGGSVLFANDPQGISEVVNDLDGELTNFWTILQGGYFSEFKRLVEATPFSSVEFNKAVPRTSSIGRAWRFFVRNRQSRQGLGRDFATLSRNRTRRNANEQVSAWLSAIDGLEEVHNRLKRVVILNDNAIKVINQQDGPRTLFYADPPYMHDTRVSVGEYGKHEMSNADHNTLLTTLASIEGKFILSGYPHPLYIQYARRHGWHCTEIKIDNKASGANEKQIKTEVLWRNYA